MGTDPLYDWASLAVSVMLVLLFGGIAAASVKNYRLHHDDRAAWSLLISLLKLVVAVGLTISSVGLVLPHFGAGTHAGAMWSLAGLSMVRGAMLVAGVVILMSQRHWR